MVPVLPLLPAHMSLFANVDLIKVDILSEAEVRVAVHLKEKLVLAFFRQRELKSDREHLRHGHDRHCQDIILGRDGNHPVYRLLYRMLELNVCLAPLRTRHGLVESDLEYDTLAVRQAISLEELSSDGQCRVRAQEGLDIPSAATSGLTSSHVARRRTSSERPSSGGLCVDTHPCSRPYAQT
jgi:hypothetical protein